MKLEKAIELNKEAEKSLRDHKFIDHADAVMIGGEAIERIQEQRRYNLAFHDKPLPGETKD